jgi:hypothetical protein
MTLRLTSITSLICQLQCWPDKKSFVVRLKLPQSRSVRRKLLSPAGQLAPFAARSQTTYE